MQLSGKDIVEQFQQKHPEKELGARMEVFIQDIEKASWKNPHELKAHFPKARILKNNNVVFNMLGNRYRVWLKIDYSKNTAHIKKMDTHKQYDSWVIMDRDTMYNIDINKKTCVTQLNL